jgi:bacteriocin-like protein
MRPEQVRALRCDGHHEMSNLGAVGEPLHSATRCPAPGWPHTSDDAGLMETTMSENKSIEKTRELTEDELNQVSGGKGDAPVKYMEYKLKEVLISGVTLSS